MDHAVPVHPKTIIEHLGKLALETVSSEVLAEEADSTLYSAKKNAFPEYLDLSRRWSWAELPKEDRAKDMLARAKEVAALQMAGASVDAPIFRITRNYSSLSHYLQESRPLERTFHGAKSYMDTIKHSRGLELAILLLTTPVAAPMLVAEDGLETYKNRSLARRADDILTDPKRSEELTRKANGIYADYVMFEELLAEYVEPSEKAYKGDEATSLLKRGLMVDALNARELPGPMFLQSDWKDLAPYELLAAVRLESANELSRLKNNSGNELAESLSINTRQAASGGVNDLGVNETRKLLARTQPGNEAVSQQPTIVVSP